MTIFKSLLYNFECLIIMILYGILNHELVHLFFPTKEAHTVLLIIYLIIIILVQSEIYEYFILLTMGARPLKTMEEKNLLESLFDEVKSKGTDTDLRLYIVNDISINAYAIGSRTIAITKGAVKGLSKSQLEGMIAHEMGHHYYGTPLIVMATTLFSGIFGLLGIVIKLFIYLVRLITRVDDNPNEANLFFRAIISISNLLYLASSFITAVITRILSRFKEYNADQYAVSIGYGDGLLSALYQLDNINWDGYNNMKQHLTRTHPYLYDRIAHIEKHETSTAKNDSTE